MFQVIEFNSGFAVQNTRTMTIVQIVSSRYLAESICRKLNGIKKGA